MIDTSLFPYENFPVRLYQKEENKIAWFRDDYDLQKYLTRYKLDKRTIKVDYRDEEPIQSGKENKNSVEPRVRKTSSRSTSGSKRSTKKLDKPGTSSRTRKPKSK